MLSTVSPFWNIVLIMLNGIVFWTVLCLVLKERWTLIASIRHLRRAIFRVKSLMERMEDELDDCIEEIKTNAVERSEKVGEKIDELNAEMTQLVQRFFCLESSIDEVHGIKKDELQTTENEESEEPLVGEITEPKGIKVL
ncbi:uncharacterized protein LOC126474894 [Schistocerca serialis cubense]|uniref:uncharacterized protein LOC126474894 n=1 Tax=Schistocerca serialis cubense TaxID=2023355 RepID=UPI00214DFF83|nr:uncharacterized protein LOC126474894 [Schistocerca serialis cubense]XP_049958345.1 uncharacterized protein LOC126474894 [Schistocerca serialis cubense]